MGECLQTLFMTDPTMNNDISGQMVHPASIKKLDEGISLFFLFHFYGAFGKQCGKGAQGSQCRCQKHPHYANR